MLAKRQHHVSYSVQSKSIPLPCMLNASQHAHWLAYEDLRKERRGLEGSYLADLDQHPEFASSGPLLYTVISHGCVLSWQKGLLSAPDHLTSMGDLSDSIAAVGSMQVQYAHVSSMTGSHNFSHSCVGPSCVQQSHPTGEALWPEHCEEKWLCPWRHLITLPDVLSCAAMKDLAGNAFHLPLFGQIVLYVLSRTTLMPT